MTGGENGIRHGLPFRAFEGIALFVMMFVVSVGQFGYFLPYPALQFIPRPVFGFSVFMAGATGVLASIGQSHYTAHASDFFLVAVMCLLGFMTGLPQAIMMAPAYLAPEDPDPYVTIYTDKFRLNPQMEVSVTQANPASPTTPVGWHVFTWVMPMIEITICIVFGIMSTWYYFAARKLLIRERVSERVWGETEMANLTEGAKNTLKSEVENDPQILGGRKQIKPVRVIYWASRVAGLVLIVHALSAFLATASGYAINSQFSNPLVLISFGIFNGIHVPRPRMPDIRSSWIISKLFGTNLLRNQFFKDAAKRGAIESAIEMEQEDVTSPVLWGLGHWPRSSWLPAVWSLGMGAVLTILSLIYDATYMGNNNIAVCNFAIDTNLAVPEVAYIESIRYSNRSDIEVSTTPSNLASGSATYTCVNFITTILALFLAIINLVAWLRIYYFNYQTTKETRENREGKTALTIVAEIKTGGGPGWLH